MENGSRHIRWFEDIGSGDISLVGGKNASLGEMVRHLARKGIRVPEGFATTAEAYRQFLDTNELTPAIRSLLAELAAGRRSLPETGKAIRTLILRSSFPEDLADAIRRNYRELSHRYSEQAADVAVRSSATAEDLPEASFAGQQESYLNVVGEDQLLDACRNGYASLFTDRAIAYRERYGFDHLKIALSVGIQKMVRSDLAGAGVIFTLDPDTGFPRVVVINASWGLGENVVKGIVDPDEYLVFKPLLRKGWRPIIGRSAGGKETRLIYAEGGSTRQVETNPADRRRLVLGDGEILQLARWACDIEAHYGRPMDIEWAKDGRTGDLFILQARPETVESRKEATSLTSFRLLEEGEVLVEGLAIGSGIASGEAFVLHSLEESARFPDGGILVTRATDPDWVPLMKRAAGIITDHGGRTSHAAIVSRELGLPAVIGTEHATARLQKGQSVTLSCAGGERGKVYEGKLRFERREADFGHALHTRTRVLINLADPEAAFRWWKLPVDGVGLARMEFIITNLIRVHPLALTRFEQIRDENVRREIQELTRGYEHKEEYFVDRLSLGVARLAAAFHPHPVILRLSDFKTNEYANLIGGRDFEPAEENPMLGFRGASRYDSPRYRDGFALECRAIARVRQEMGFTNLVVMVPFCRTPEEADRVLQAMAAHGLRRGAFGLKVYMMAEIPSNILLAEEFARRFDGFSIGSNDLTQLVLGVDRDSEELAPLFDERNPAVKRLIRHLIASAHKRDTPVGICGQAPSDYPDFVAFLVETGIDSISVNPDSLVPVRERVAEEEKRLQRFLREHRGGSLPDVLP